MDNFYKRLAPKDVRSAYRKKLAYYDEVENLVSTTGIPLHRWGSESVKNTQDPWKYYITYLT